MWVAPQLCFFSREDYFLFQDVSEAGIDPLTIVVSGKLSLGLNLGRQL